MSIDYTKLNDRIVKQAYDVSSAFLTEAQVRKLFQNKIDRASAMIRAQEQFRRLEQEANDWLKQVVAGNEGLCRTLKRHKRAASRMELLLWSEKFER